MSPFSTPSVVRILLLAATVTLAAPSNAEQIEIAPRGTYFEIEGPMSVRGRDLVDVNLLPDGAYRVQADGMGLAKMRRHFEIDREGLRPLSWSGPTSMLMPPGLEHLQNGESRGWFHLLAGAVGGAFLYTAVDDLGTTTAGSEAEFDAENIRNLWTGYVVAAWVSAGLETWLLTPQGSVRRTGDTMTFAAPRADRWDTTFRSVLVPGAGQRYLGRDSRANMFTALFTASAAAAITTQDLYLEARRDKQTLGRQLGTASDPDQRAQLASAYDDAASDEDSKSLIRWIAVGATAYVYLWNVFDAFSLGRHAEASSGPQVVATPTNDGMALSLSWSY